MNESLFTSTSLPSEIIQHFSRMLLTTPCKMGQDSSTLWEVYIYIKHRLLKRANHDPITKARCKQLEETFLDLYERAKTKEKNKDEASKNKTQVPLYYIECPDKRDETIFERLRYCRGVLFPNMRKYHEI